MCFHLLPSYLRVFVHFSLHRRSAIPFFRDRGREDLDWASLCSWIKLDRRYRAFNILQYCHRTDSSVMEYLISPATQFYFSLAVLYFSPRGLGRPKNSSSAGSVVGLTPLTQSRFPVSSVDFVAQPHPVEPNSLPKLLIRTQDQTHQSFAVQ